jgi:DNA-binding transcriptional regulator YiaG
MDGQHTARAIQAWREAAGFTREQVAVFCERSVATVTRWEKTWEMDDGTFASKAEPRIKDIQIMEGKHPGLIEILFRKDDA